MTIELFQLNLKSNEKSGRFNPMKHGDPVLIISMFEKCTQEALTEAQRKEAVGVVSRLTKRATILDFVKAAELLPNIRRFSFSVGKYFLMGAEYTKYCNSKIYLPPIVS